MAETEQDAVVEVKPKYNKKKIVRNLCIAFIAITVGYINYRYVSHLHENLYHFSHLSELEREMTLSSECGFYYSYYKTMVEEKQLITAITKLMYDRHVEYPNEVNAFNRFNIHPEVIIGTAYRYLEPWLNTSTYRQCHLVNRGPEVPPVQSCEGVGEPVYFYLQAIWILAGTLTSTMFLLGTVLSNTILGGLLTAVEFFANHAECVRVQTFPNIRENFATPLLFAQMALVTTQLRAGSRSSFRLQVALFIINCLCLLFWQFTQFIFLTQVAIFFMMNQLMIIDSKALCVFLHSHFSGIHTAVLLLQGNNMLKSSLYISFFFVVSAYCLLFSYFRIQVRTKTDFFVKFWLILLRTALVICLSFYFKHIISDYLNVKDDGHIWDLLYAKFTGYKSFHTMIYTCIDAFNFLSWRTVENYTKTFLIPFAGIAIVETFYYWVIRAKIDTEVYLFKLNRKSETSKGKSKTVKEVVTEKGKVETSEENFETSKEDVETDKGNVETNKGNNETNNKDDDTDDSGIENTETATKESEKKEKKMIDLNKVDSEVKKRNEQKKVITDKFIIFLFSLKVDAAIFYNICQLLVFAVMATLFMRLKCLFGPQLCVVASLFLHNRHGFISKWPSQRLQEELRIVWGWAPRRLPRAARGALLCAAAAGLASRLAANVAQQMSIVGEFSDAATEELLTWIARETPGGAVFAASLPLSAAILLSARRAVVAHPHYETQEARDRAYAVYKTYGRSAPHELYLELSRLRATHLVVETQYCFEASPQDNKRCTFLDIWDSEAPSLAGRPALCRRLLSEPTDHLYSVFRNRAYTVHRIHDLSVRYMPRVFDT